MNFPSEEIPEGTNGQGRKNFPAQFNGELTHNDSCKIKGGRYGILLNLSLGSEEKSKILQKIKELIVVHKLQSLKIPEWENRIELFVTAYSKDANYDPKKNDLLSFFRKYNSMLKTLYPQTELCYLDLYINLIGTISYKEETEPSSESSHAIESANDPENSSDADFISERGRSITKTFSKYKKVTVGGTFDHLHCGHKILLTMTAQITGEQLICGVTGANLPRIKKNADLVQPLDVRMNAVKKFLGYVSKDVDINVIEINDPYGPTVTDIEIEAIVCTDETFKGCEEINRIRESLKMPRLDIYVVDIWGLDAFSMKKFGSTDLRRAILQHQAQPGI